jgi:hypothetical protein
MLTSKRELHIKPMKLLSRAIWTASLTDIVVRPLLCMLCVEPDGDCELSAPSSLQSNIGSDSEISENALNLKSLSTYNSVASS